MQKGRRRRNLSESPRRNANTHCTTRGTSTHRPKLDELLAQVDTLKCRVDSIPALLKRFRQSVLAAAVSGRLTEDWRHARRGSRMEKTAIKSVCSVAFDGPFGSKLKSDDYTSEGVRVVRLENIGHMGFISEKETFISPAKFKELAKNKLEPGIFCFRHLSMRRSGFANYQKARRLSSIRQIASVFESIKQLRNLNFTIFTGS